MNLRFLTVARQTLPDGRLVLVERANVTNDRQFWVAWRTSKDAIKAHFSIRKDADNFYVYRRRIPQDDTHLTFPCSYSLRDSSGLLPYQPAAVARLCASILSNGAAADGSDTGIGKTYAALAAARDLGRTPIIICKLAGVAGWSRAASHLGITLWGIWNWESLKTGKYDFLRRARHPYSGKWEYRWRPPKNTILIFDEAHVANNSEDNTQNFAMWIASRDIPSISCSATFADRPTRLEGLFRVLGITDADGFAQWIEERGVYVDQYGNRTVFSMQDDMIAASKLIYPKYGVRLSYDDPQVAKFFPQGIYQVDMVTLSARDTKLQNAAYEKMLDKVREYQEKGKQADVLVANLRYRQAAELLKAPTIADLTREYIYEGKSVCVFVNFRETLSWLARELNTRCLVFGDQERYGVTRQEVIDTFQADKSRVILCMTDAGGQSISLHDLNGKYQRLSLICPTYNPIALQQVLGRTRRAGSKSTPIMKLIYAAGTIEEKVAQSVIAKLDNIAALNDGDLMEPGPFNKGG